MTKKILFTIPNFITAGSGRALLNIVERLDQEKFTPLICVLKKGGKLEEEVVARGIPLLEAPFTVPALPYYRLPLRAWKTSRFFRPYKIDIWHSFHYLDDYTEPIIAKMAGAKSWIYTKKNMNWNHRSWFLRSLFASRIAVQNKDMMRDFFSHRLLNKKSALIQRGVDIAKFAPDSSVRPFLREKYNIPDQAKLVGTVSHMVPVKGHPTLLDAFSRLSANAYLLIAGKPMDKEYFERLKKQVHALQLNQRVIFINDVSDVPQFLSQLDIFVFPTWKKWRQEGCPVALLEAMSSGRPCIATDIPGSRDIIQNGVSGVLVAPESAESLSGALDKLLNDSALCTQFGIKARQRVVSSFSIDREVNQHMALYNDL